MKARSFDRKSFGRPRVPSIVPLSCPDCAGVLSVSQENSKDPCLYICQVNHRHSITSLYRAMEERLENTLWTVSVMLTQLNSLYEELLSKQRRPSEPGCKALKRRLKEVRDQRAAIGALIEGTHVLEAKI